LANAASSAVEGRKYEGYFELRGVAKPGKTPEAVEAAIDKEVEKLKKEPVGDRELQKVKNQNAAQDFRGLQNNFNLMFQLLIRDSGRGWQYINTDPKLLQAVTAADIQRVCNTYFTTENRAVAIYYTKKPDANATDDPLLTGLDDEERQQVQQVKAMASQLKKEQVQQFLQQLEQQASQAPADKQDMIQSMRKILETRLKALEGAK